MARKYGNRSLCVAFITDLTRRSKRTGQELQNREATLRAIVSSAGDAVIILDGRRRVTKGPHHPLSC